MSLVESLGQRMQEAGIPTSEAVLIVTAALDDADERWAALIEAESQDRYGQRPDKKKSRDDEALDILVAMPATASAIKH